MIELSGLRSSRAAVRFAAIIVVISLASIALVGCGSNRSVAAYCHVFYGQGTQLRNGWINAGNNVNQAPLTALVSIFTAPQQLADFFKKLDSVAPNDIEPDVATVQKSFQKEADSIGKDVVNPKAGIISGLENSLSSAPAYNAVDRWTTSNCGPPPGTKWLN